MSKLFELVGGDKVEIDQQWRVLDALFDLRPLCIATLAIAVGSFVGWQNGLHVWATAWTMSALVVLMGRWIQFGIYRARSRRGSLQNWKKAYFVALTVTGAQWGIGGLAFLQTDNSSVLLVTFGVITGIMTGASSRTAGFPAATAVQVSMTGLAMIICNLLAGVWTSMWLQIVFLAYQFALIKFTCEANLKSVLSEQENYFLMASLEARNAEIATANARLQEISMTDALTGVSNRRCFDRDMSMEWTRSWRKNSSVALLFIDVDHFKIFNDDHGHQAGDECLRLVATAIASAMRFSDRTYRYGGEEFAVLLADTEAGAAHRVADHIVDRVRSIAFPVGSGQLVRVTVSIGVAALVPKCDIEPGLLLATADQGVYRAKEDGRNCVRAVGREIDPIYIESAKAPLAAASDVVVAEAQLA